MAIDTKIEDEIARLVRREVGPTAPQLMKTIVEEVVQAVAMRTTSSSAQGSAQSPPPTGATVSGAEGIDISDCIRCRTKDQKENRNRGVITATGHNTTGIIAKFATTIAEFDVDILDISQTIIGGFFTMIIVVELDGLDKRRLTFADLKQRLLNLSKTLGVQAIVVHEEIFRGMQRI